MAALPPPTAVFVSFPAWLTHCNRLLSVRSQTRNISSHFSSPLNSGTRRSLLKTISLTTFATKYTSGAYPRMNQEVTHQPDQSRFIVQVDEAQEPAFLTYIASDTEKVYDLNHTYTPPALRGKGIAATLVKHAISFARENDYKIIPTCSYVAVYMERHPEDKDVLKVE